MSSVGLCKLGSLTKLFTAATIVSLSTGPDARLALHQPVGTYLTDLPPRIRALTFDQLLTHQAGLVDRTQSTKLHESDLFLEPGRMFSYSTLGYVLAGQAAASATGTSFEELLTRTLFGKLGMEATSDSENGSLEAVGYYVRKEQHRRAPLLTDVTLRPTGLLYSNVGDLSRFAIAFMNGELSSDVVAQLSQPRALIPGESLRYGYGTFVGKEGADTVIYHMGDEYGGSAYLKMAPAKKCAVIVLTNLAGRLPRSMATALRLSGGVMTPEEVQEESSKLDRADVAELMGNYLNQYGLSIKKKGSSAVLKPWFPWFLSWLPGSRELVKFGVDRFGIAGTPLSPKPIKVTVLRNSEGRIEFLFVSARVYKRYP